MVMLPNVLQKKEPLATLATLACDCLDIRDRLPIGMMDISSVSERFLDYLGWQFHVDEYRLDASIAAKREAIQSSLGRHAYKGTKLGVWYGLKALGYQQAGIHTYFDDSTVPLNRFSVELVNSQDIGADIIMKTINENKSARTVLHTLVLRERVDCESYIVSGVRIAIKIRV